MRHIKQQRLKIIPLCLTLCFLLTHNVFARKDASIVICAETGKIHHEHQADVVTHPASLTKMMTLYMTFKALKEKKLSPNQTLSVSHHASKQAPSKLWLKPGATLTVREAILALITKSANDAAVVLAETLAGTEVKFAQIMTRQAQKLGMTKTVFKNASGLPNMQQITTARDMATLSRSLYKHFPDYFHLFKTQKFVHKGVVHGNHNKLLGKVEGMDGIKTGFINASGFNLAASVVRDNRRVIAVVMGGESAHLRDKKMVKLLETTFTKIKGKSSLRNENNSDSIEHLIQALGPVTTSPKSHITHATFLTKKGDVKTLKAKYNSVDEILNVIEDKPKHVKAKSSSAKKPEKTTKSNAKPKVKAISTQKLKAKNKNSPMTNTKKQKQKKRLKQA
ncbi:MAG: D-alanyl-D-alanine carboxypeptidase [Alphaproteobacteria bacterium]|nr:D-alanyl-D-alanine carboxypeptidase [Alphaproteobacteria bacterium]